MAAMNIGEMQRLLSLKAEREPGHKFGDLYSLICREDWLRLACACVSQNAGSKTAGCDGLCMSDFEADLERKLARLGEALRSETFAACPVRRVYIPKTGGKLRPLGIPTLSAYCTSFQGLSGFSSACRLPSGPRAVIVGPFGQCCRRPTQHTAGLRFRRALPVVTPHRL